MTRSLFIGRWQPFHLGHYRLIKNVLDTGKGVVIAIRNTSQDEKNPLTALDRQYIIEKIFKDKDVEVIIIPDIDSICVGRNAGYSIERFNSVSDISGTYVRQLLNDGCDDWKLYVPESSVVLLENLWKKV